MPHPPQEEPLDLGGNLGWCHACGKRRILCAFAMCVACHVGRERRAAPYDPVGELCHGWWRTGPLDMPWTCPTCGRVHG